MCVHCELITKSNFDSVLVSLLFFFLLFIFCSFQWWPLVSLVGKMCFFLFSVVVVAKTFITLVEFYSRIKIGENSVFFSFIHSLSFGWVHKNGKKSISEYMDQRLRWISGIVVKATTISKWAEEDEENEKNLEKGQITMLWRVVALQHEQKKIHTIPSNVYTRH